MISLRSWILIAVSVIAAPAVIVLGDQYFREPLKLQWRTVAVLAVLPALVAIVATLWVDTLREGSRRPEKPKNDKQRS